MVDRPDLKKIISRIVTNGEIHPQIITGLEQLVDLNDPVDDDGNTPMHLAIKCNNLYAVSHLLDMGCSGTIKDAMGNTVEDIIDQYQSNKEHEDFVVIDDRLAYLKEVINDENHAYGVGGEFETPTMEAIFDILTLYGKNINHQYKDIDRVTTENTTLTKECDRLDQRIQAYESVTDQLTQDNEFYQTKVEAQQDKIDHLEQELIRGQQKHNRLLGVYSKLFKDYQRNHKREVVLKKLIIKCNKDLEYLESENVRTDELMDIMQYQIQDLKTINDQLMLSNREYERECHQLTVKNEDLESVINVLNTNREESRHHFNYLNEKLRIYRDMLDMCDQTFSDFATQVEYLNDINEELVNIAHQKDMTRLGLVSQLDYLQATKEELITICIDRDRAHTERIHQITRDYNNSKFDFQCYHSDRMIEFIDEVANLTQQVEELSDTCDLKSTELNEFRDMNTQLSDQISYDGNKHKHHIQTLTSDLEVITQAYLSLTNDHQDIEVKKQQVDEENESLRDQLTAVNNNYEYLESRNNELSEENSAILDKYETTQSQLHDLRVRFDQLKSASFFDDYFQLRNALLWIVDESVDNVTPSYLIEQLQNYIDTHDNMKRLLNSYLIEIEELRSNHNAMYQKIWSSNNDQSIIDSLQTQLETKDEQIRSQQEELSSMSLYINQRLTTISPHSES